MLVVSVMFSPLVNPSSGAPARSIINARDALCFTGGHSRVLSLQHIILIRPDSIKTHCTQRHRERHSEMHGREEGEKQGERKR